MELTSVSCLINSIYRFIHLATCCTSKMPSKKDFGKVSNCLRSLKPLLDLIIDFKIPSDETLCQECKELDLAVNEARIFLEKWSLKMSKILCVLQSARLVTKIRNSSLKISCTLLNLLELSSTTLGLQEAQSYMNELQNLKLEKISEQIEEALESQKQGNFPQLEHLIAIMESFMLTSKHEMLNECIALEKEKIKAEEINSKEDLEIISEIIYLISHIRDYMAKHGICNTINGIQIPSMFFCPLSLEIMVEPVIIASGQTFEKASIQKWLDNGLYVCPKAHIKLLHTNLTLNLTVKALIANWFERNNIKPSECPILSQVVDSSKSNVFASKTCSEVRNNLEKLKNEASRFDEEFNVHSFSHSRSESESSAISSVDYITDLSRVSNASEFSLSLSRSSFESDKGNKSDSNSSELTTKLHVEQLIEDLESQSIDLQTSSTEALRFLAKYNTENRVIIGNSGAITSLITLLRSNNKIIQEHSVTALLNLSINEKVKTIIAEKGALEPLIHVLKTGNACAKENAAATLFSLSLMEEYRVKIGRSEGVKALIDLLQTGTIRGKKDAATALFNLSIFHENKARIIQSGAVKHLVELLDPENEMVDKSVALLSNLSTIPEGCIAISKEGGIPLLVEIVEMGTQRGKENAASTLLQLCVNNSKYCRLVLQEGAVPPLVALSQSGTPRGKEKAQQLLSHFRSQRDTIVRKSKD